MRWIGGGVLAVAVILMLAGEVAVGIGLVGLSAAAVGVGALAVGQARWAGIGNRQGAGIVTALGVVMFVAGGLSQESVDATAADAPVIAPDSAPSGAPALTTSSPSPSVSATSRPTSSVTTTPTPTASAPTAAQRATAEADRAVDAAPAGTALAALAELEIKGRAPKTGYEREAFGQAWADVDRNGCDTRNDVLRRDLDELTLRPGTGGCVAATGILDEPFSGEPREFIRGQDSASQIHIDHVVSLSDAWQKGAQPWDAATREGFANDPINLIAVDGALNSAKGDADTATWLPPNRAFRCEYVARQVSVKVVYELWVTAPERDAMARVLSGCPDEPLITADDPPAVERDVVVEPEPEPKRDLKPGPDPKPKPEPESGTDPRFGTCGEAIDAGYGPYVRGIDPEYEWYRDADSDGKVCER